MEHIKRMLYSGGYFVSVGYSLNIVAGVDMPATDKDGNIICGSVLLQTPGTLL